MTRHDKNLQKLRRSVSSIVCIVCKGSTLRASLLNADKWYSPQEKRPFHGCGGYLRCGKAMHGWSPTQSMAAKFLPILPHRTTTTHL